MPDNQNVLAPVPTSGAVEVAEAICKVEHGLWEVYGAYHDKWRLIPEKVAAIIQQYGGQCYSMGEKAVVPGAGAPPAAAGKLREVLYQAQSDLEWCQQRFKALGFDGRAVVAELAAKRVQDYLAAVAQPASGGENNGR